MILFNCRSCCRSCRRRSKGCAECAAAPPQPLPTKKPSAGDSPDAAMLRRRPSRRATLHRAGGRRENLGAPPTDRRENLRRENLGAFSSHVFSFSTPSVFFAALNLQLGKKKKKHPAQAASQPAMSAMRARALSLSARLEARLSGAHTRPGHGAVPCARRECRCAARGRPRRQEGHLRPLATAWGART